MDGTTRSTRPRAALSVRRGLALVVAAELLLVAGYFALTPAEPTTLRYVLYPLVWMTLGVWAVARTPTPSAGGRARLLAGAASLAYLAALLVLSGFVGGTAGDPHAPLGLRVGLGSPGWGPRLVYVAPSFYVALIPYRLIGYLGLTYLAYVTVVDATRAALPGALALVSCVGCSFPVIASLATGAGASAALTATVSAFSLDVSTATFVLAVALLAWRPGTG